MSTGDGQSAPLGEIPKIDLEAVERSINSSAGSPAVPTARFRLVREFGRPRAGAPPAAGLSEPITLAVDAEDRLLVLDRAADGAFHLWRFSADQPEGERLAALPRCDAEGILNPTGLALDGDGQLYVSDGDLGAVVKFSPDGRWLETYRAAGGDGGPFSSPRDVDVDAQGRIIVADSFNDRVAILRPDGEAETLLTSFTNPQTGQADDSLFEPNSVCAGDQGQVFIADTNQHRVLLLQNQAVRRVLGGPELFELPNEVRLSRDRRTLYVADQGGTRIQRFKLAPAAENLADARTGQILLPRADDAATREGHSPPAEPSQAAARDIDVTSSGHVALINARRSTAVVLDFPEP